MKYEYQIVPYDVEKLCVFGAAGWRVVPGTMTPRAPGQTEERILMERELGS